MILVPNRVPARGGDEVLFATFGEPFFLLGPSWPANPHQRGPRTTLGLILGTSGTYRCRFLDTFVQVSDAYYVQFLFLFFKDTSHQHISGTVAEGRSRVDTYIYIYIYIASSQKIPCVASTEFLWCHSKTAYTMDIGCEVRLPGAKSSSRMLELAGRALF